MSRRLLWPGLRLALLLVLAALLLPLVRSFDFLGLAQALGQADPRWVIAGLGVFWLSIGLRVRRWQSILAAGGQAVPLRPAAAALILSWTMNCLVPLRLGDAYRAVLLRERTGRPVLPVLGSVAVEHIVDLALVLAIGLLSGLLSLGPRLPVAVLWLCLGGLGALTLIASAGFLLRAPLGRSLDRWLPGKPLRLLRSFSLGLAAMGPSGLPHLLAVSAGVWSFDTLRLTAVLTAFGLLGHFSPAAIIFIVMAGALLSSVPISPAGLGIVETGIIGLLHLGFGLPLPLAAAVLLVDRAISVGSLVLGGGLVWGLGHLAHWGLPVAHGA